MYWRIYKNIMRSPRAEILGKCTMTNIVQLEFNIAIYREHEARKIVLLLLWRRRRRSSITSEYVTVFVWASEQTYMYSRYMRYIVIR